MSADPAVEAARRAWDAGGQGRGFPHATEADLMIDSAREALARIRELHESVDYAGALACSTCITSTGWPARWPCATARLCYPEEEL